MPVRTRRGRHDGVVALTARTMRIRGSCHCGNIAFALDWTPDPTVIPARACGCSFCAKHGGVWTSCPTGSVDIAIRDAAMHSLYAFGTKTADFHVCATCCGVWRKPAR